MSSKLERSGQADKTRTTILRTEVTVPMVVAGACVLEAWLAQDVDSLGLSPQDVVAEIYSAMELERDQGFRSETSESNEDLIAKLDIAQQLINEIKLMIAKRS